MMFIKTNGVDINYACYNGKEFIVIYGKRYPCETIEFEMI